jgi:hypothetical protein
MMRHWASWTLLPLLGCTSVTGPSLGDQFTLRVSESVTVNSLPDHPLGEWIRFVGVAQDSRCPTQVRCVWQGDAAVVVESALVSDRARGEVRLDTLHTTTSGGPGTGPDIVELGIFELRLVSLTPYPETPGSIRPAEYVATFLILFSEDFAQECMASTTPCY